MEVKKKSIFKRILAFGGALLCAFAFCFGIVNISNNHKETLQVSADSYEDTNIVFNGSDLWFPYDNTPIVYTSSEGYFSSTPYDYSFLSMPSDWLSVNLLISFTLNDNGVLVFNGPIPSFINSSGYTYYFCDDLAPNLRYGVLKSFPLSLFNNKTVCFLEHSIDTSLGSAFVYSIACYISVDTDFDYSDVVGVTIYTSSDNNGRFVRIKYLDANNLGLSFAFYCADNFSLSERTYYFSNSLNLTDNQYYNQGFNAGQSSGYNSGFIAGENKGYSDGYGVGKNDGYNLGYNTAIENSNIYSFDNLLSAVIDVPVRTFTSLFNFEILGVNLSGFFLGLLTCCIVVAIVRFIL